MDLSEVRPEIMKRYEEFGNQGLRILGLCYKDVDARLGPDKMGIDKKDETEMTFLGFIVFFDPIKIDVIESITKTSKLRHFG